MQDFLSPFVNWVQSEHGVATLEYIGGLLLAPEVLTLILGKKLTVRFSAGLSRVRTSLNPINARTAARRITLGPVSWIALALCTIAFGWILWQEVRDPKVWQLLSANDPSVFRWLIKVAWLIIVKPLFCIGIGVGVYITGSSQSQERFNAWIERLGSRMYQAQMRRALAQQFDHSDRHISCLNCILYWILRW